MKRIDIINKAYQLATGKVTGMTTTTKDKLIGLLELFITEWQNEPDVTWDSLYRHTNIGTVSATDTFELDDTIASISKDEADPIIIRKGTEEWYYTLVPPSQLGRASETCARMGRDLVFSEIFTVNSRQLGGSIIVPGYIHAEIPETDDDTTPVDNPLWLVYMIAAEFVRNKEDKKAQYGNLVALAQNAMEGMKFSNGAQDESIIREEFLLGESWS